ncbi:hypothetical protein LZ30DRAFT_702476 [Colletotrichum cereale]|nr:hypothetical protein LZ30DRAFT_702476 [Colletotrichum cereale]
MAQGITTLLKDLIRVSANKTPVYRRQGRVSTNSGLCRLPMKFRGTRPRLVSMEAMLRKSDPATIGRYSPVDRVDGRVRSWSMMLLACTC